MLTMEEQQKHKVKLALQSTPEEKKTWPHGMPGTYVCLACHLVSYYAGFQVYAECILRSTTFLPCLSHGHSE